MTSKDYFRSLALHDLGIPTEPEVLVLQDYIIERLSNLNQYTSKEYPDFIFYGKSKDAIILNYNSKNEHINLYYDQFSSKSFNHFGLQNTDIEAIIPKYVADTLQIKVNDIVVNVFYGVGLVVDTLQIKVNYIKNIIKTS
jgi:hypothetical protein